MPVISAVGHETDVSISDFAADLRCATPSVASETAVFDYYKMIDNLSACATRIDEAIDYNFESLKEDLKNTALEIQSCCKNLLDGYQNRINQKVQFLYGDMKYFMSMQNSKYDLLNLAIQKDNPLSLLSRGYVVAEREKRVVKSAKEVDINDTLDIKFIDGVVEAKVTKKEQK